MFVKATKVDLAEAVYWDGDPSKAATLVERSRHISPDFAYTPASGMTAGVLTISSAEVYFGYWIVWPDGLTSDNVQVYSPEEFAYRYQVPGAF